MDPSRIPAPARLPDTEPYWAAARDGILLIKRCRGCCKVHSYPRDICPHCLSDDTAWERASGHGTIYSFSHVDRKGDAWTLAYVTLEEGVTMMTNLVECDPDKLTVGQAVSVMFVPSRDGQPIPMFRPA